MPILKNIRRERFAQEIVKGTPVGEAYEKAGYKRDDGNAAKLYGKVQARIQELTGRAAARAGITKERVLSELGKLGFSNMRDYTTIGKDGLPFFDFTNVTPDQMAAVQELVVEERTATERNEDGETEAVPVRKVRFKLADKRQALETIGRHLGMFKDSVDLNINGEVRFVLEGAPQMKTIEAVSE